MSVVHKIRASGITKPEEDILHFTLSGLIKAEHVLALDVSHGIIALLAHRENGPRIIHAQQFTTTELCTFLPIIEAFPHYCPYEQVLAGFEGQSSTTAIDRARQRLHEAYDMGQWDDIMRPIRNALSRVRMKIRDLDLEIASISETGYLLRGASQRGRRYAVAEDF